MKLDGVADAGRARAEVMLRGVDVEVIADDVDNVATALREKVAQVAGAINSKNPWG